MVGCSKKQVRKSQPESMDEDEFELCVEYSDSDEFQITQKDVLNVELKNDTHEIFLGMVAPTLDSIREAQEVDPDFVVVTLWVKLGELSPEQKQEGLAEFPRACVHSFSQLHVVENVLVLHPDDGSPNQRIIVPKSLVTNHLLLSRKTALSTRLVPA